jgi:hypothetical protein
MSVPALWALSMLALQQDPFEDLDRKAPAPPPPTQERGFFEDNFTLKYEIYSQFSYSSEEPNAGDTFAEDVYSRQSLGFEILKKFSTATATAAAFNVQGRLVRRDHYLETLNDREGEDRDGWYFEVHNLYADLYNPLVFGALNVRAGHFYLPFGINLQTDTHGTLLQLSNDRNFGFERDWYAGFWGSISRDLDYDAYFLLGSGAGTRFEGQGGLAGVRLRLADRFHAEHGIQGGVALMYGRRLDDHALMRSASVAASAGPDGFVGTERIGVDGHWVNATGAGTLTFTAELSVGRDEDDEVFTQLYQVELLSERRQWGLSAQYRRFWQDLAGPDTDASLVGEVAWYFRNDPSGAFLHSLRFNLERRLERMSGPDETVLTLQYYLYW